MIKLEIEHNYFGYFFPSNYIESLINNPNTKNLNTYLGTYEIPNNSLCLDIMGNLVIAIKNTTRGVKVFNLEYNEINYIVPYKLRYLDKEYASKLLKQRIKEVNYNITDLQEFLVLLEASKNLIK